MRLLYLDRIIRIRRRQSLEALLVLPPDEPIFALHFPGNPMLPASLALESLAQAATVLLEVSSEFTLKGIPGFIREAKFRRAVRPSDPLRILIDVEQWSDEGAVVRGRIEQRGVTTTACLLGMVTAPLTEFYRPEHAAAYRSMYERWLDGAELHGFDAPPLAALMQAVDG